MCSGPRELGRAALAALIVASSAAMAQTAPLGEGPLAAFERASVLPSHPAGPITLSVEADTREFRATNAPLQALIAFAYDVHPARIVGGPDWVYLAGYHVEGTAPAAFVGEDAGELVANMRVLVQGLLFDHFGLEVRKEDRVQGYVLERADDAPVLQASATDTPGTLTQDGPGQLVGRGVSIAELVAALEPYLEGRVLDRTELPVRYDFVLRWEPRVGDINGLAVALEEQLGLELRAVGRDVLVIEHVNQPPSE